MTARPQDVALLPCPFCGGRAKSKSEFVRCVECGAQMNFGDEDGLDSIISSWNRRSDAALASAQAREEELRAHIENLEGAAHRRSKEIESLGAAVQHHASRAERLEEALRDERAAERAVEAARSFGWRPAYEGEEEAYYERLLAAQDAYQNARARTDALSTNAATQTGETNEAAD